MIRAYHRPRTVEEALQLIARTEPRTVPMGGGTALTTGGRNRPVGADPIEVVDLQALQLNSISRRGKELEIGATVTLQALLESDALPPVLGEVARREAPVNIRNMATIAGTIVACDGRSPFVSVLLALDAKLALKSGRGSEVATIGEILPLRRNFLAGKLISDITIPLQVKLAYEFVARTPADKPIVCAALAQWPSGRTRLVIGGFGAAPSLAMDGTEAEGASSPDVVLRSAQAAARNACHEASDDWGSAEYRMEIAAKLAARCLENAA